MNSLFYGGLHMVGKAFIDESLLTHHVDKTGGTFVSSRLKA